MYLLLLCERGGGASEECLEVCLVGLLVRGDYVWCLVIFDIFLEFGIWTSKEKGDALKSSFVVLMGKRWGWGEWEFPLCNNFIEYMFFRYFCYLTCFISVIEIDKVTSAS